jgi:hypothetical protein
MKKWVSLVMLLLVILISMDLSSFGVKGDAEEVTYDGRSLIINGQRNILFSGSIHYPRSTPQVYIYIHIIKTIYYIYNLIYIDKYNPQCTYIHHIYYFI